MIPGRCVSSHFTRLLKRAKPPFFSATMLFLDTRFTPWSQFLYSAAVSAFSVFHSLPLDLYSEACLREPSKVFLPPSHASCPRPMPYFFFFFFFLEDNFFIVLCWFLLYIEVNQAYGHIYPLPLDSHLIPALWVITDPRGELPVL